MKTMMMIGLLLASGCTAPSATKDALKSQGFTEIETNGYAVFGCSDDDEFHTKFTATNPNGQRVTGVACCGWLKNCTLRW